MPAGRQGIRKAGRSTQGTGRGLRTGASFPVDIMAARRDRVAQAVKSLGKGKSMSGMEITFTRENSYSMFLTARKKRDLADHLDITVRDLDRLVERGDLMDEHEGGVLEFMEMNSALEEETEHGDREIEEITLA